MVDPIVEKRFEYKSYPCVILFMPMCYRCGYVGLKRGVAYNTKEIECHGGITYNEAYLWKQDDPDKWWIGFDCMHYPDGFDIESGMEYWRDNEEQYNNMKSMLTRSDCRREPWSLKRVENECKFIVDQIEEDLHCSMNEDKK